jgi:DNA replication protein DnaC
MTPHRVDKTDHEITVLDDALSEPETIETRLARARLPFLATIEAFDFSAQPVLRAEHLAFQLSASFVAKGESLILSGKSGRGKTHLAVAIAQRAIELGYDAVFVSASRLVDSVASQVSRGRGRGAWQRYLRPSLLVLDDIGFAMHNAHAASVLFQIVSERHRLGRSMIVTAHKPPEQWGELLCNQDAGEAIVERLLEAGAHIELGGPSMRSRRPTEVEIEPERGPDDTEPMIRLSALQAQLSPEDGEALCKRVARELVGRLGLKEAIYHLRGTMNFEALERSRGSRRAAANLLGVDRRYVQRLADDYAAGCAGLGLGDDALSTDLTRV